MSPEELANRYPAFSDLRKRARRRIPHFAWEYLDSGTGAETALTRNVEAMARILLNPVSLKKTIVPDSSTRIFDHYLRIPGGVAPVGMSGLIWPGSEIMLARAARQADAIYCLSTVACETIEAVGAEARGNAWFQLYPFADWSINEDLVRRAQSSGFAALVLTMDVQAASIRERQRRAGLRMPPAVDLRTLSSIAARPAWALATLRRGRPALRILEKYVPAGEMAQIMKFVASHGMGRLEDDTLSRLRKLWKGPLVVKGVMSAADARAGITAGADAIWVSNHGARQLDAAPAAIDVLPEIADAVSGKARIIFDSGIRSGLDMARAIASGADLVFAGRPFLHAVAALGEPGAAHAFQLLRADLENAMIQLGTASLAGLRERRFPG